MKRIIFTGLLVLIVLNESNAWELNQTTGARTNSIGNCSVAFYDFWSLNNNPAGFASYRDFSFGIAYENKFLLKELGNKNAGLLFPINLGTIGVSFSQFGYEHYSENLLGIGLSKSFGNKLRIGLKLYYLFIKFSGDYQSKSVPTFDLGIQYQIKESLCIGTYIFNPINVKIGSVNKDQIPIIMRLGFSYHIIDNFMICGEIENNSYSDISFRFGLEYEIYKNIIVRSGFQFKPEIFTFGIGYNYKWFKIDFAAQMNQDLGSSLSCSMIFNM